MTKREYALSLMRVHRERMSNSDPIKDIQCHVYLSKLTPIKREIGYYKSALNDVIKQAR